VVIDAVQRVRVVVTGLVQGVSYRASTATEASRLGLSGWVRNLADGSVELEAQGAGIAVQQLVAWCHHGPRHAQVATVEVTVIAARPLDRSFVVRH
jgi:acylphosphatase